MSIEYAVDVKLPNLDVPANLMLKGFLASEAGFGKGAVISLGGVDILKTQDSCLEKDMERIEREIRDGTLSIDYRWNESLIPIIEMTGERERAIDLLEDSFRSKDYKLGNKVSPRVPKDSTFPYVSSWNDSMNIDIWRRYFNAIESGFSVEVICGRRPSDDFSDRLNKAKIAEPPCSFSWGREVGGKFSYLAECALPARTGPSSVCRSLSQTAFAIVDVLKK